MKFTNQSESVRRLQNQVTGSVITPEHMDYNTIRLAWNRSLDQFPALILIPENAQDVVGGVRFANEENLGIGVQATGHGIHHPADDNLLINTSRMTSVQIDPETRTARVGAGIVWEPVIEAAAEHGLAPLVGSSPHVGIVGYSLTGGIGWMARKYGLAADSILSIDVVTGDGVLRHASADENADLFWGLRGGAGSLGVVTAIEFALYPVETLYGGTLIYPGELVGEALRFFRDWAQTAPDELTSSLAIMKFPAAPQLPEAMRGKTMVMVRAAYVGDATDGEAQIQKWLDWHAPISNAFHEMPFAEIGTVSNDPVEPGASIYSNEMFDSLSDEAIDIIARNATDRSGALAPLMVTELRHAGGAIARVNAHANAIGNRDAQFYIQIAGMLFAPQMKPAIEAGIAHYKADLQPYFKGGVYLNFMRGHEGDERVRDAFPDSYDRLVALKTQYDPENRFRYVYQLTEPKPTEA